jgi:hypothetical protein
MLAGHERADEQQPDCRHGRRRNRAKRPGGDQPDAYTDANSDSDADSNADSHTHTHADADANSDSDADSNADSDADSDADSHTHADADANPDSDSNADSHTHADADAHPHTATGHTLLAGVLEEPPHGLRHVLPAGAWLDVQRALHRPHLPRQ